MAFCISCGSEMMAQAMFCHQCGTPRPADTASSAAPTLEATRTCLECGNIEPSSKKFCGECGAPLDSEWLAGSAASQPAAFQSPAPATELGTPGEGEGIDEIVDLGTVIQAEKRNVTVIFGDISGFTALSETIDAEEVREIMNRCFDGMVQSVKKYEGNVDKFIGDCIMVVFGAPVAHEDDPERAVRCAIEMQDYLREVNKTLPKTLGMRIGINAGEAVAGGVGGEGRMDYTVMGDTVNLAQRLESNARVGHILVSRSVERLTARSVRYKGLKPIMVKGKQRPVEIFEVQSLVEDERSGAGAFVGRATERAALEQALAEAASNKPTARLVLGEAGMGKSRLLGEVAQMARAGEWLVARAAGGRFGVATDMDLVRQAVFSLCEDGPGQPGGRADERLERLGRFGLETDQIQRLQHLFGTAAQAGGFEREEAQLLDRAAVLQAFQGAADQAGLCLLLDDTHLADPTSLGLLGDLLQTAAGSRLLVVAAARPEGATRVLPQASRLSLGPMPGGETVQLAREQIGGGELPEALARVILERAAGVPFYATELVRHFIDEGALELAAGSWRLTGGFDPAALPDGVGWLVASRLDKLSEDALTALKYAATIGRVFSEELLAGALGADFELRRVLGECANRQVIVANERPAGSYRFSQDMVHQAVLRGLVKSDARHIHRKIAEAMEVRRKSDSELPAETIAEHFLAADQKRKAVRYFTLAADRLAERGASVGAVRAYQQALDLSLELAGQGSAINEAAAAHVLSLAARAVASQTLVTPAEALAQADRTLAKIPSDRAPTARAQLVRERGQALLKAGKPQDAEESFEEAARLLGDGAGGALAIRLRADRAEALEARGKLEEARTLLLDGIEHLSSVPDEEADLLCQYYNQLGRVQLRWKEIESARHYFELARSQARRAESAVGEARAVANLAGTVAGQGKTGEAQSLFAEALELAQRGGDRIGVARIHYNLGRLLLALGQRTEAEGRLNTARRLASELGWREGIAAASQALGALRARPAGSAAR